MLATLGFLRLVAWPRRRAHRAEDRGGPRDEGGVACTSFRGSRRLRDRQPAIEDRTPRLKLSTDPDSHGHGDDSGSRTRLSLASDLIAFLGGKWRGPKVFETMPARRRFSLFISMRRGGDVIEREFLFEMQAETEQTGR